MDFPDLKFIRSEIDPATVKPLDTRDLIGFVNQFMLTSADLLDSFCGRFEQSILTLETRMDSFERQLILLERKLADIPLEMPSTSKADEGQNSGGPSDKNVEMPVEDQKRPNDGEGEKVERKLEEKTTNSAMAKEHPVVGKYFRMLKMGVPEPAVRQKMRAEGVDPAILDEPDKPMPIFAEQQKAESSSSSSDSETDQENCLSSLDNSFGS